MDGLLKKQLKIHISEPMLQRKSLELVASLNIFEFKASNGWFEAFRKKNRIKYLRINSEEGAVDVELCNQWFSKVNQIIGNYSERDFYNMDETGLLYRGLPHKTLSSPSEKCKDGKFANQRLTVVFCSNLSGKDKLKPLVIGHSEKPRCFSKRNITFLLHGNQIRKHG